MLMASVDTYGLMNLRVCQDLVSPIWLLADPTRSALSWHGIGRAGQPRPRAAKRIRTLESTLHTARHPHEKREPVIPTG